MPHFPQLQIGHRRSSDHAVPCIFKQNLLSLGLLLRLFRLAAEWFIENLFRVRHVEDRGRPPAWRFRYAVGIPCPGARVEIRHELRLGDLRGMICHAGLNLRHLNPFAILHRQPDPASPPPPPPPPPPRRPLPPRRPPFHCRRPSAP